MKIRRASLAEFSANWYGGEPAGSQFRACLQAATAELWVAKKNFKVVGKVYFFKALSDTDFADATTRAYITNFYVASQYRGQGIGTKLLEAIFAQLKQNGFSQVTIGVDESESQNLRLYQKLGFVHEIKKCSVDPICVDEKQNPIPMSEFLLLAKYL